MSTMKPSWWYPLSLSLAGAFLLWAGWPTSPLAPLLFVGFVPWMVLHHHTRHAGYRRPGRTFVGFLLLGILAWNLLTTWWVALSTVPGGIMAFVFNTLLMAIPWMLYRLTTRWLHSNMAHMSLVIYWLAWEWFHLHWELSWPWLTLGNGLAMYPEWIQWYNITGVLGGSLWVLLGNFVVFVVLFNREGQWRGRVAWQQVVITVVMLSMPALLSFYTYSRYIETGEAVEVVIIQPNVDPYADEFIDGPQGTTALDKVHELVRRSQASIDSEVELVVWPETVVEVNMNVEHIEAHPVLKPVREWLAGQPEVSLLTGLMTHQIFGHDTDQGQRYRSDMGRYDIYNSASLLRTGQPLQLYHKSKLVPGAEGIPYRPIIGPLASLVGENFTGSSSGVGVGKQQEPGIFDVPGAGTVAPLICYESIYGDFAGRAVRAGAEYFAVISNDAWWGDTPGHRQHFHYASLQAIAHRRSVARCANTGVSCFINQRGDIEQATTYWEQAVIRGRVHRNSLTTVYSEYGDYLGRTAGWLSVLIFLVALVRRKLQRL